MNLTVAVEIGDLIVLITELNVWGLVVCWFVCPPSRMEQLGCCRVNKQGKGKSAVSGRAWRGSMFQERLLHSDNRTCDGKSTRASCFWKTELKLLDLYLLMTPWRNNQTTFTQISVGINLLVEKWLCWHPSCHKVFIQKYLPHCHMQLSSHNLLSLLSKPWSRVLLLYLNFYMIHSLLFGPSGTPYRLWCTS